MVDAVSHLLASFCSSNSFAMSDRIEPVSTVREASLKLPVVVSRDKEHEREPVESVL